MKLTKSLVAALCFWTASTQAAGPVLMVGIESFLPPFVMQGAKNEIFGFDIDLMNGLCDMIQRTCRYQVMRFDELLQAVYDRRIDAAVSAITITLERAKKVSFTLPYMLSYSQFLQKSKPDKTPFSLEMLYGKRIGIESGSIFYDQIISMGIKNATISQYGKIDELLNALNENKVDFILLDSPTATYWAANSSGAFMTIGESYMYGNGLGIAVNQSNTQLLNALNDAILKYQNSDAYKSNYDRYLSHF